jgi:hypothetical protein
VGGHGGDSHSNSTSPQLSAKEEVQIIEDGPNSRGSKGDSKDGGVGGDRAKRQVSFFFIYFGYLFLLYPYSSNPFIFVSIIRLFPIFLRPLAIC